MTVSMIFPDTLKVVVMWNIKYLPKSCQPNYFRILICYSKIELHYVMIPLHYVKTDCFDWLQLRLHYTCCTITLGCKYACMVIIRIRIVIVFQL